MRNDERRVKIFKVSVETFQMLLNWKHYDALSLPLFPDLPEDAYFEKVNFCFERNCFLVMVHSEEFEVVSEACLPPIIGNGCLKIETVVLKEWV